VQLAGSKFEATGSYEQLVSGFALAALGLRAQSQPDRYRVSYKGTVEGHAIYATISRTLEDDPSKIRGLLSSFESKSTVLMFLTDDGKEIRVMEKPEQGAPKFYTLTRS
jgi:hypothetical protein